MKAVVIDYPWPASVLSPNSRAHWRVKAKARASQRTAAAVLTCGAVNYLHPLRERVAARGAKLDLMFVEPDRRPRDIDNLLASCKGLLDGIADALGVDDHCFRLSMSRDGTARGGIVRVRIT